MTTNVRADGAVESYAAAVRELVHCQNRADFAAATTRVLNELLSDQQWAIAVSDPAHHKLVVLAASHDSATKRGDQMSWPEVDRPTELRVALAGTGDTLGFLVVQNATKLTHIALRHHVETLGAIIGSALEHVDQQHQLEELTAELHRREGRDVLTNLLSRTVFMAEVDAQLQNARSEPKGTTGPAALCLIDVDHFSLVNSVGGHSAGDAMLRQVAERITRVTSRADPSARFDGDRFGVLLIDCSEDAARVVAERMRREIDTTPFVFGNESMELSVTIGVAVLDNHVEDAVAAIAEADAACFAGKHEGRNQVVLASRTDRRQRDRLGAATAVREIKHAVATNQLIVHVQPIVNLNPLGAASEIATGRAYELLVRMPGGRGGDNRGLRTAAEFVIHAEQFNLVHLIDQWVVAEAIAILESGVLDSNDRLFVNLSAKSIEMPGFVDELEAAMQASSLDPSCLCFEITETAAVEHFERVRSFTRRVHDRGCLVALDDFGSGTSSLGQLKELPVDFVKIDGTLVKDVAADPISRTLIAAVQSIASALGAETIAEHVEDHATSVMLRSLGVTKAQGFHFAEPAPLSTLAANTNVTDTSIVVDAAIDPVV